MTTALIKRNFLWISSSLIGIRALPFILQLKNGGVLLGADSSGYYKSFMDLSLVGGQRGLITPLLFSLAPNTTVITIMNNTIVSGALILLFLQLSFEGNKKVYSWIIFLGALLFTMIPGIQVWETWVLAQSLSLAIALFFFTSILRLKRIAARGQLDWQDFIIPILICLVWVDVRPGAIFVALIFLLLLAIQVALSIFSEQSIRGGRTRKRSAVALSTVFATVLIAQIFVANAAWGPNAELQRASYLLIMDAPSATPLHAELLNRSNSDCLVPPEVFPVKPVKSEARRSFLDPSECLERPDFFRNNLISSQLKIYLQDPFLALRQVWFGFNESVNFDIELVGSPVGSISQLIVAWGALSILAQATLFATVATGLQCLSRATRFLSRRRPYFTSSGATAFPKWLPNCYIMFIWAFASFGMAMLYFSHGANSRLYVDMLSLLWLSSLSVLVEGSFLPSRVDQRA